jgi:hypothetical protein
MTDERSAGYSEEFEELLEWYRRLGELETIERAEELEEKKRLDDLIFYKDDISFEDLEEADT